MSTPGESNEPVEYVVRWKRPDSEEVYECRDTAEGYTRSLAACLRLWDSIEVFEIKRLV